MGILAPVLAYAGQIAANIARVRAVAVERRRQQFDQTGLIVDQVFIQRLHRLQAARFIPGTGQHRPALGDGIDATLRRLMGAQRLSAVKVTPAIPFAVPGVVTQIVAQGGGLLAA
ncbi:hypothetical protein D3C80_1723170 [compost metagenome]